MTKQELIKELEELRDIKNYSESELLNTGYKTAILDALDLVNKHFDLALLVERSQQEQSRIGAVSGSFTMQDLILYYQDKEGLDFTSKVVDVLNCMANDR